MTDNKRFVRTSGDGGVFVPGHGVVAAGSTVEVESSDAVNAAVEQGALADAQPPKQGKGAKGATNENKEGGGS